MAELSNKKILIVDDDENIITLLSDRLKARGYLVLTAVNGKEALQKAEHEAPSLLLLDLQLPDLSGLEILRRLRRTGVDSTVIIMTAHGTIERAVEAIREGAYNFITKPFEPAQLELQIEKALERDRLQQEYALLHDQISSQFQMVVGNSPAMQEIIAVARRAAKSKSTVLILGESGTGKELLARAIHNWSPRTKAPFVVVNCVAIPEQLLESELFGHEKGAFTGAYRLHRGKFENAHEGTIFLDEIGEITTALQAKLLRVLQEQSFERVGGTVTIRSDVRLIAATNSDLRRAIRQGHFREDIYYRLNVVSLTLPPLRERREDIPTLAEFFLRKYERETKKTIEGITQPALHALIRHSWGGNIRELENAIERAVVLSTDEMIDLDDLPHELVSGEAVPVLSAEATESRGTYHELVDDSRREIILNALRHADGNQTRAAELLGLQRTYLARLMKNLGLR